MKNLQKLLSKKFILSAFFTLSLFSTFNFAFAQVYVQSTLDTSPYYSGNQYNTQQFQKYPTLCQNLQRTFGYADSGQDVKQLQIVLGQEGIAYIGATGYFGPVTRNAVKVFQLRNNISQTGAVGPITLSRMRSLWCQGDIRNIPNNNVNNNYNQNYNPNYNSNFPTTNTTPTFNTGNNGTLEVSISPITSNGYNITLGWNSKNANSCNLNGEIVNPNGTKIIYVGSQTDYTITCNGFGTGSVSKTITLRPNQTTADLPTVNVFINPTTALVNTNATLFWSSTNSNYCTLNGQNISTSGSQQVYITNTETIYRVTCFSPSGLSAGASVSTSVNQAISNASANISANNTNVQIGSPITLTWTSSNASACTVTGIGTTFSGLNGTQTVYPTTNTTYTLSCAGINGQSVSNQVTIYVTGTNTIPITISASPANISAGQNSTISWNNSANTFNHCNISGGTINLFNQPVSGSVIVNPTTTTTYTINCYNVGGVLVASAATTVTIGGITNTNTVTINPTSNTTGATANISWSNNTYTNAQGVIFELINSSGNLLGTIKRLPENTTGGVTYVNSGSIYWVIPKSIIDTRNDAIPCQTINGESLCGSIIYSGQYKIRATYFTPSNACLGFCQQVSGQQILGTSESDFFSITSTVGTGGTANISASISANPSNVAQGQPTTLTWSSTNANYCNISANTNNLLTNQSPSGTYIAYPSIGTNYVITCYNNNGQNAASYVYVTTGGSGSALPTANIYASTQNINSGQQVNLNWYATNANSCALTANGNSLLSNQSISGSYLVYPTISTTYQIICTNTSTNQTATSNIYVTVGDTGSSSTISILSNYNRNINIQVSKTGTTNCPAGYINWGDATATTSYSYTSGGSGCQLAITHTYSISGTYLIQAYENNILVGSLQIVVQ